MKRTITLLAVGALALLAVGCGSDKKSSPTTVATATTVAAATTIAGGATTVAGGATSVASGDTTAPGGTDATATTAAGASGPKADAAAAAARIATALKPITDIGVSVPLKSKPPTGKTVAWIGGGLQSTQPITPGFKTATAALGWTLKIINYDPANPQTVNAAVQQAVDQGVDYIAISGTDIASFQQAADAAKAKGIPIIDMYSSNPATGKDGNGIYAVISDSKATEAIVQQITDWVIADSAGKANAVLVTLPEFPILQVGAKAGKANFASACADCKMSELDVTLADLGGGKVPGLVVSYLQTHPETTYVVYAIGDLFSGVPEALSTAGIKVKSVGGVPNVEQTQTLIDKQSDEWSVLPRAESGWHAVDAMARLSIGQDLSGVPSTLVTAIWDQANVPKPAAEYGGAVDYENQFKKLWGLA
jgi:ABC-type sugar transport system substrate-binding protein